MFLRFLRYLLGYLKVEFSGEFNERILNLLSFNNVSIWGIEKKKDKIYLAMPISAFKRMRKIRGDTKIKTKIIQKAGVPFLLKRYRLRIGALTGVVLFAAIIYFLSCFVWHVDVVGNQSVSKEEILSICSSVGLNKGTFKSKINSHKIRDLILLNSEKLAWASINVEGCVVTVNVSEIKNTPQNNDISNIVADYNAVIKKITVQKGSATVKVGDAVQKGDLLISGVVTSAGHSYFTNATGVVLAEVEDKITVEINKKRTDKISVGNSYKKYALEIFNLSIPLYLGTEQRLYDYTYNWKPMYLFGREMPIGYYVLEISPYSAFEYELSKDEIEIETELQLKEQVNLKGIDDYEIKNKTVNYTDSGCITVYTIKYLKNIGVSEKILF